MSRLVALMSSIVLGIFVLLITALPVYAAAPTLTSFAPTSAKVGQVVTITGTSFAGATSVGFNNATTAVFSVVSDTTVTATVPRVAVTGKISVTTPDGIATSSTDLTVIPAPIIDSFAPSFGKVGQAVTISGMNFTAVTSVKFNGTTAFFTVGSDSQITATVPNLATTGSISVATPSIKTFSVTDFTVYYKPTITSFSRDSGKPGDGVLLTGTNFTGATSVEFNGNPASFTFNSATSIKAIIPEGATTGPVSVVTPCYIGSSTKDFVVYQLPTITSFEPNIGEPYTNFKVIGTNLNAPNGVVKLGDYICNGGGGDPTAITAMVPSNALPGKYKVTVQNDGGTTTSDIEFTVIPGPRITSFSPTICTVGDTLNIYGEEFDRVTSVYLGNVTMTPFTIKSAKWITLTIPNMLFVQYNIRVSTGVGDDYSASNLTVSPPTPLEIAINPGASYLGSLSSIALQYSLSGPRTYTGSLPIDNNGKSSFHTLVPGTYDLTLTGSHWLKRIIKGIDVNGINSVNTALVNGDADGDGQVNLFDFVVLDMNFGSYTPMADLDGDGNVNLFDYTIIDQFFGAQADL